MRNEWIERQIGDYLHDIKHGFAFKGEYFTNQPTEHYLVTPANFAIGGGFQNGKSMYYTNDFPDEYILDKGDLIVTMTDLSKTGDTLGFSALVPKSSKCKYLHNQRIGKVIVNEKKADKFFIYWLMRTYAYQRYIVGLATGSTVKHTAPKSIKSFKYRFPPLPTQTRIAEILSAYDNAIENNNRRIALLDKAASDLYREWFVRMRFPGYESVRVVNGLPEGWKVKRLGAVVNITSSKRIYLSDYVDDGTPFFRSKEIIQLASGQAITEPLYIERDKYEELKDKFGAPAENDILITSVGTIGVSHLVDDTVFYFKDGNLTWLQSGATPKLALYVFLWLNSDSGKSSLLSSTIGTSQSALTIENLKKIKLVIPSDDMLSDFYAVSWDLIQMKRKLQKQSQNLTRQRDLLLPRLMSGKLEV